MKVLVGICSVCMNVYQGLFCWPNIIETLNTRLIRKPYLMLQLHSMQLYILYSLHTV